MTTLAPGSASVFRGSAGPAARPTSAATIARSLLDAHYTGYQLNGGYAEYAVADAAFCFPLPANYDDVHVAPLLRAGLIGYRAYRMAGPGATVASMDFGAAAHIIAQVALHQGRDVFAFFVAPGDHQALKFSRDIGATWAGF